MASVKKPPTGKKPAAKKPAEEPKVPAAPGAQAAPNARPLVQPLAPDAFKFVLAIIDNAEFKGGDAGNVIMLKNELARVAGMQQKQA